MFGNLLTTWLRVGFKFSFIRNHVPDALPHVTTNPCLLLPRYGYAKWILQTNVSLGQWLWHDWTERGNRAVTTPSLSTGSSEFESGYPDWGSSCFSSVFPANSGTVYDITSYSGRWSSCWWGHPGRTGFEGVAGQRGKPWPTRLGFGLGADNLTS